MSVITQEQLDKVRDLNYDHHRRMTILHENNVASGLADCRAEIDVRSYRTLLSHVPPARCAILEIGASAGNQFPLLGDWLAEGGTIVGIDLYEPKVREAQHNGLPVTLGFVETLPYDDNSFDLVCSRHVMEHLVDLQEGMRQIMRVTKPGGFIAHVTPNMIIDEEPSHLNHRDGPGWRKEWESVGLIIISVERHEFNGGEIHLVGHKAE